MDAKAAIRSRMKEATRKRARKIVSPLVSYNDLDQPVCKVCNITLKSETLWTGHIASRQHRAAVEEFKAKAALITQQKQSAVPGVGPTVVPTMPIARVEISDDVSDDDDDDIPEPKRPSAGGENNIVQPRNEKATEDVKQIPAAQGILPEGFFDNQIADSRARGVEPVKLDIRHEYEEFQKSIEGDVQGVDARLEEEEYDAAEEREERDQIKQRDLLERINLIRSQQQKKVAVQTEGKKIQLNLSAVEDEESSEESDDEDNLLFDWRAKRL